MAVAEEVSTAVVIMVVVTQYNVKFVSSTTTQLATIGSILSIRLQMLETVEIMGTATMAIMGTTTIVLTGLKIRIIIKIGVRIRIKTTTGTILLPIGVHNKVRIRITTLRTLTLGLHKLLWWQILTPILHPLGFQILEHPSM